MNTWRVPVPARRAVCAGSNICVFACADCYHQEQELRARFQTCGEPCLCSGSTSQQSLRQCSGAQMRATAMLRSEPGQPSYAHRPKMSVLLPRLSSWFRSGLCGPPGCAPLPLRSVTLGPAVPTSEQADVGVFSSPLKRVRCEPALYGVHIVIGELV